MFFLLTTLANHEITIDQQSKNIAHEVDDPEKCPEEYFLWFHHLSWDHKMKSGRTLWEELCHQYDSGVDSVKWMQQEWDSLEGRIDGEQFNHVKNLLSIQRKEAQCGGIPAYCTSRLFPVKTFPRVLINRNIRWTFTRLLNFPLPRASDQDGNGFKRQANT